MQTFGDSTKTPGQFIGDRCYILAQIPERSNLDWARDLRTLLGGDELKYQKYLGMRHRVQANSELWKRIVSGTAEATVVVIENQFYIDAIAFKLQKDGADLGHDISFDQILKDAALCMIAHAPVMRLPNALSSPALHRPLFTPQGVYTQIGEKFSDAMVFAARAHATFDVDGLERAGSTNEMLLSPHWDRSAFDVNAMNRVFDNEHPQSAVVLNKIFASCEQFHDSPLQKHFSELSSEAHDALQAADFCAGFASEIMMNATDDRERDLRQHFRRVIFNGVAR